MQHPLNGLTWAITISNSTDRSNCAKEELDRELKDPEKILLVLLFS